MDDPRRSAHRDLEEARAALDRGEIRHAADHLAGAIAHAPTLPETHELLSHLAARADDALDLFPLEQHAFVGAVVARAHLLAAAGRPEDGLPLLAAASGHTPGIGWADVPWVRDPALGLKVEPGLLARMLMKLCTAQSKVGSLASARSIQARASSMRPASARVPAMSAYTERSSGSCATARRSAAKASPMRPVLR